MRSSPLLRSGLLASAVLLAACTESEIDTFFRDLGALLLVGVIALLLVMVVGAVLMVLELIVLVMNLIRPAWLTVAAGIAIGALHGLSGAATGVLFLGVVGAPPAPVSAPTLSAPGDPPPSFTPPPPYTGPLEEPITLLATTVGSLVWAAGHLGAAWVGRRRLEREQEQALAARG